MATYLFGYAITQFLVFFVRANVVVSLGPLDWGLKQAQWTSLIFLIALIPLTYLFMRGRYARPVPAGEVPATYGIPQGGKSSDRGTAGVVEGKEGTGQVDEDDIRPVSVVDVDPARVGEQMGEAAAENSDG